MTTGDGNWGSNTRANGEKRNGIPQTCASRKIRKTRNKGQILASVSLVNIKKLSSNITPNKGDFVAEQHGRKKNREDHFPKTKQV